MIRLGLCTALDNVELVASLGFDYLETSVSQMMEMDEAAFEAVAERVDATGLRVEAFNVLLPGTLSVTGETPSTEADMRAHLTGAIRRMRRLGGEVVVFGSGRARRCPEGFSPEKAEAQLRGFLRLLDEVFDGSGLTVVIEPLNKAECNQVNRVAQAQALVEELNLRNVAVLGDIYHMLLEEESFDALVAADGLLRHLHVAEPAHRNYPRPGDGVDYEGLFARLKAIGYRGRMSIEGGTEDMTGDAPIALNTLRQAMR